MTRLGRRGRRVSTGRWLLRGAVAGAAGATALDVVTYLDMTVRGRPASTTPEQTVEQLATRTGVSVPGSDARRDNRVSGLGGALGLLAGVAGGVALGALHAAGLRPSRGATVLGTGAVVMLGTNLSMTGLGVTDPRTWSRVDWLSDVVPHLVYGAATGWSMHELATPR